MIIWSYTYKYIHECLVNYCETASSSFATDNGGCAVSSCSAGFSGAETINFKINIHIHIQKVHFILQIIYP